MSKREKFSQNKDTLVAYKDAGLAPKEALRTFRASGGKYKTTDFYAAYRQITGQPRAAYNIGGAKRAAVKKPQVEKYEKKKVKERIKEAAKPKRAKKAAKPSKGKKRTEKRKTKERRHKAGKEKKANYQIKAIDIQASTLGKKISYQDLKEDLQAHGIRAWNEDGSDALYFAKSGDTVHVYGMAIYERDKDEGGQAFGVAGSLITKIKRSLGVIK